MLILLTLTTPILGIFIISNVDIKKNFILNNINLKPWKRNTNLEPYNFSSNEVDTVREKRTIEKDIRYNTILLNQLQIGNINTIGDEDSAFESVNENTEGFSLKQKLEENNENKGIFSSVVDRLMKTNQKTGVFDLEQKTGVFDLEQKIKKANEDLIIEIKEINAELKKIVKKNRILSHVNSVEDNLAVEKIELLDGYIGKTSDLSEDRLKTVENNKNVIKRVGLIASIMNSVLIFMLFFSYHFSTLEYQFTQEYFNMDTILRNMPLDLYLGLDGSSIYFVILTSIITPIAILSNWKSIKNNVKSYIIIMLLLEILLITVFLVLDTLSFYIFFESILPPLFLLVGFFGSTEKVKASYYLFLYTLFGSLFMLLSILSISLIIGIGDYSTIYNNTVEINTQLYLFIGIFIAFAVKTPTIFLNIWLLKAHVESPLAGSIILAAIVLKLSLYGIIRLILPLLPKVTFSFTYVIYTIAVITILYASVSTLRTVDIKELIAYSSVSHAAVYILGVFSNIVPGILGAIVLGLAHGFVSSGLFICAGGTLYDRSGTRLITMYRGMTVVMPLFGILFLILCLGNAGTPLTLNFLGEFMSLYGAFTYLPLLGGIACSSIVLSAAYTMYMYNRISFGGSYSEYFKHNISDINRREFYMLIILVVFTVIFGIYLSPISDGLVYSLSSLIYNTSNLSNVSQLTMCFISISKTSIPSLLKRSFSISLSKKTNNSPNNSNNNSPNNSNNDSPNTSAKDTTGYSSDGEDTNPDDVDPNNKYDEYSIKTIKGVMTNSKMDLKAHYWNVWNNEKEKFTLSEKGRKLYNGWEIQLDEKFDQLYNKLRNIDKSDPQWLKEAMAIRDKSKKVYHDYNLKVRSILEEHNVHPNRTNSPVPKFYEDWNEYANLETSDTSSNASDGGNVGGRFGGRFGSNFGGNDGGKFGGNFSSSDSDAGVGVSFSRKRKRNEMESDSDDDNPNEGSPFGPNGGTGAPTSSSGVTSSDSSVASPKLSTTNSVIDLGDLDYSDYLNDLDNFDNFDYLDNFDDLDGFGWFDWLDDFDCFF